MDPLSAIAAGFNIADVGVKLSTSLYTFAETARKADEAIKDIARDVALSASVIRQLKTLIDQDTGLIDDAARKTADEVISGCETVFSEIESAVEKTSTKNDNGTIVVSRLQRLKWPLKQPRVALMQAKLERSKLLLLVILNIFLYAQRLAAENRGTSKQDEEYQTIAQLMQKNQELEAKYNSLARKYSNTMSRSQRQTPPLSTVPKQERQPTVTPSQFRHDDGACLCGRHPDSQRGAPSEAHSFHITRTDLTTCMLELEDFLQLVRQAQSDYIHQGDARRYMCHNVLLEFQRGISKLEAYIPISSMVSEMDTALTLNPNATFERCKVTTTPVEGSFFHPIGSTLRSGSRSPTRRRNRSKSPILYPPEESKDGEGPCSIEKNDYNNSSVPSIPNTTVKTPWRGGSEDWRGRHSNQWLFNEFSISEAVRQKIRSNLKQS